MMSGLLPRAVMCTCSNPAIPDTRMGDWVTDVHDIFSIAVGVILAHRMTFTSHDTIASERGADLRRRCFLPRMLCALLVTRDGEHAATS